MLDANEKEDDREGALRKFLDDTGLVDTYSHIHDGAPEPTSHIRGSKKIDHFLLTPGALDCIMAFGIESLGDSVDSNHCGVYLDFDSVALFGDSTPNLTCMTSRILHSHIPFFVRKYCCELQEQLMHHNVYARVGQLKESLSGTTDDLIHQYKAID